jgi:hypothetical protein
MHANKAQATSNTTRNSASRQSVRQHSSSAALPRTDVQNDVQPPSEYLPRPEDPKLVRALLKEAVRRGDTIQSMAAALGCTCSYVRQMRSGLRQPEHLSSDFAERSARYLGVPAALVKLLSGQLTARDFVWPRRNDEQDIEHCLNVLRDDPAVGAFVPDELSEAHPMVKLFVWQLYTECADIHPAALRQLPRAFEYLQRAALVDVEYGDALAQLRETMGSPEDTLGDPD